MDDTINQSSWLPRLGDWSTSPPYDSSTRSSDFLLSHFKAFLFYSSNNDWNTVIDTTYILITNIQQNYSALTGLLPDFIIDISSPPKPAVNGFLEENDGDYYYNACRDPWRLALDYLIYGENRAKDILTPLNSWIKTKCNNNPLNIKAGYKLNGDNLANNNYDTAAFISPFGVSAMINNTNQQWLNDIWDYSASSSESYYEDSIALLSMLVMSGN